MEIPHELARPLQLLISPDIFIGIKLQGGRTWTIRGIDRNANTNAGTCSTQWTPGRSGRQSYLVQYSIQHLQKAGEGVEEGGDCLWLGFSKWHILHWKNDFRSSIKNLRPVGIKLKKFRALCCWLVLIRPYFKSVWRHWGFNNINKSLKGSFYRMIRGKREVARNDSTRVMLRYI